MVYSHVLFLYRNINGDGSRNGSRFAVNHEDLCSDRRLWRNYIRPAKYYRRAAAQSLLASFVSLQPCQRIHLGRVARNAVMGAHEQTLSVRCANHPKDEARKLCFSCFFRDRNWRYDFAIPRAPVLTKLRQGGIPLHLAFYALREASSAVRCERHRLSKSEFVTTDTELSAIAPPAIAGLRKPQAARGMAARL